MNSLKYQHLFTRGEGKEGDAPGKWQDKATPGRRLSASLQPHLSASPANPAPQPHTASQQPTPQVTPEPEQQMYLSGFSEHPSATSESDAVGSNEGRATGHWFRLMSCTN